MHESTCALWLWCHSRCLIHADGLLIRVERIPAIIDALRHGATHVLDVKRNTSRALLRCSPWSLFAMRLLELGDRFNISTRVRLLSEDL